METPSRGGPPDLESLQRGRRFFPPENRHIAICSSPCRQLGALLTTGSSLCLPSIPLLQLFLHQVQTEELILVTPLWPHMLVFSYPATHGQDTPGAPCSEGPPVPGEGVTVPSFPSRAQGDSLYPERERLHAWPDLKVRMLQEFCALSTRTAYCFLRGLFASWCAAHQLDPHQTTVNMILCELHTLSVQRQ